MNCEIRDEGGVAVIALSGDIDLKTSPELRATLLDCVGTKPGVLVDMAAVSYIDSSGVASLVEAYQSAKRGSISFALVAVSEAAIKLADSLIKG